MAESKSKGGCPKHGPYEVCGHTDVTCPDKKVGIVDAVNKEQITQGEIFARTFTEARQGVKIFPPEFVTALLNNELQEPDGSRVLMLKNFLDLTRAGVDEEAISKNPEKLGELHEEIADMIANNLQVRVLDLTDKEKQFVKQRKQEYIKRLKQDSDSFKKMIEQLADGKRANKIADVADYRGFNIPTQSGTIDISDQTGQKLPNVRPNIRVQREITGQFIHWETDKLSSVKLQGAKADLDRRIYLNPNTPEAVKIFTELMKKLNEAGIAVQGKVLDRSYELAGKIKQPKVEAVRADTIVLYTAEQDADVVLNTVLAAYQANKKAFAGRPTPAVPMKVAPGISVGDEPHAQGESLTSHRADVIGQAVREAQTKLGIVGKKIPKGKEGDAVKMFQSIVSDLLRKNDIDPKNIAFNLAPRRPNKNQQ